MPLPGDIQDVVEVFVLTNLNTIMSPNPFGTSTIVATTITNTTISNTTITG